MKKFVFAAFVAFWSSIGTLLVLDSLAPEAVAEKVGVKTVTLAELAEHNTPDDCWMAIEGKVYDFTDYLPDHPAHPEVMAAWCGREATEGMRTKGYGRNHSPAAWGMMEAYRVGELAGD